MASERYPVKLVGQGGEVSQGVFVLDEAEDADQCRLSFQYPGGKITAEARDYFAAMCHIRRELDRAGWRPVCFGSSRNVYPASAMGCAFSRGMKAEKLRLARPLTLDDVVMIFDSGPDVEPASVEEQIQFFLAWCRSQGIISSGGAPTEPKS
jgi:hypothetical protein